MEGGWREGGGGREGRRENNSTLVVGSVLYYYVYTYFFLKDRFSATLYSWVPGNNYCIPQL